MFVPGLFGSMGDEIIPGTGDWHFGLAGIVYKPFVKLLERELGLKEGENFFVSYYDWRKPIEHSARRYLYDTIEHAKKITGKKKVVIISHSMGGLVSRSYVESNYYKFDVSQLIMMCTPNAGSPPNFSYWTGGSLPGESGDKFNLVRLYMDAYLWLLPRVTNMSRVDAIHEFFKGLKDITPGAAYGNYLFMKNNDGEFGVVPYQTMNTKNNFLDGLNNKREVMKKRHIPITLIGGIGEETIRYLEVEPSDSPDIWIDGEVTNSLKTELGDGNATLSSVFSLEGDKHIFQGSHNEVLYKSLPLLAKKLGRSCGEEKPYPSFNDYSLIILKGKGHIKLKEKTEHISHLLRPDTSTSIEHHMSVVRIKQMSCLVVSQEFLRTYTVNFVPHELRDVEYLLIKKGKRTESRIHVSSKDPIPVNALLTL